MVFEDGESLHEVEDIYYALWPRTGGRSPDELDDEQVQVLGRLLARIHNTAEAASSRHRPRLDSPTFPLAALALLSPFAPAVDGQADAAPLRVFLRAGPKTHGPGQHDHPRFLDRGPEELDAGYQEDGESSQRDEDRRQLRDCHARLAVEPHMPAPMIVLD